MNFFELGRDASAISLHERNSWKRVFLDWLYRFSLRISRGVDIWNYRRNFEKGDSNLVIIWWSVRKMIVHFFNPKGMILSRNVLVNFKAFSVDIGCLNFINAISSISDLQKVSLSDRPVFLELLENLWSISMVFFWIIRSPFIYFVSEIQAFSIEDQSLMFCLVKSRSIQFENWYLIIIISEKSFIRFFRDA